MNPDLKTKKQRRRERPTEDEQHGRDCISQMRLARSRPDVLANALREMGVTETGDEIPDQERTE